MAESERLKHAPQTVVKVKAEQDHGHDVKERHWPELETGDYIVVDVVFFEGPARVHDTKSEMQEVEDYEGENDGAAPHHRAGRVSGMEVGFFDIPNGPGGALQAPELKRCPDMKDDGNQQSDARSPQERRERPQRGGVVIDFFGRDIHLEITEEMSNYEAEEQEAGYRHDGFLADGSLPEAQRTSLQVERSGTHGMCRTLLLLHLMTHEV